MTHLAIDALANRLIDQVYLALRLAHDDQPRYPPYSRPTTSTLVPGLGGMPASNCVLASADEKTWWHSS